MKGWSIRQAAAARRGQNAADRAEIDRIRREHIAKLDAELLEEAQSAPESAATTSGDETSAQTGEGAQSGAEIPQGAVIPATDTDAGADTSEDAAKTADGGEQTSGEAQGEAEATPDRFETMPDDEIREFLAGNGVRVASNWGRDALLRHARATEEKLANGEQP